MDLIDREAVMSTLGDLDLPDVHAALPVSLMLAVVKKALEPISSVDAVPLDKLCEWLEENALDITQRNVTPMKTSAEHWKRVLTNLMEGLDAAD